MHDYYGIDYEILWDVFTQKIQPLHAYLANLE
ncbi:MAG: HepT-like ribonuclease domain-containing protein [Bacteroidota bacterium]